MVPTGGRVSLLGLLELCKKHEVAIEGDVLTWFVRTLATYAADEGDLKKKETVRLQTLLKSVQQDLAYTAVDAEQTIRRALVRNSFVRPTPCMQCADSVPFAGLDVR